MRNKRHYAILSLIQNKNIETQQELTAALSEYGFDVTQATVSRDIKELRLVKTLSSDGKYRYSTGKNNETDISGKFHNLFHQEYLSILHLRVFLIF